MRLVRGGVLPCSEVTKREQDMSSLFWCTQSKAKICTDRLIQTVHLKCIISVSLFCALQLCVYACDLYMCPCYSSVYLKILVLTYPTQQKPTTNEILRTESMGIKPKLLPRHSPQWVPNLGRGTQWTKPSNQSGYKPQIRARPRANYQGCAKCGGTSPLSRS